MSCTHSTYTPHAVHEYFYRDGLASTSFVAPKADPALMRSFATGLAPADPKTWLLDVDGVIADFCGGVDAFVTKWGAEKREWRHWGIKNVYPVHADELISRVRDAGFAATLPEIPRAVESVRRLIATGARVVFVTSPMSDSPTWCFDRKTWLADRFGDVEIVFAKRKDLVRGDVFVDDTPEHVSAWWDRNPSARAFLVRQRYNAAWHPANFAVDDVGAAIGGAT